MELPIVIFLMLCMTWQAHAVANCVAAGWFADPEDSTCQAYTLCVFDNLTSTHLSYNYMCPSDFVFNPNIAQCTPSCNYECPARIATSFCTTEGYIADPTAKDCSTYIECVKVNGFFIETYFTCPYDTYFNPETTFCDANYKCCTQSTFDCTSAGRFAKTTDLFCKAYYMCVPIYGKYMQYEYVCPTNTFFSPTARICTPNYTCMTGKE